VPVIVGVIDGVNDGVADRVPVIDGVNDGVADRVDDGVADREPVGVRDFVGLFVAEAVGEQDGCKARPVDRHTLHEHTIGTSEPKGQKYPIGQTMQEALGAKK
jgi:hypothetical protein